MVLTRAQMLPGQFLGQRNLPSHLGQMNFCLRRCFSQHDNSAFVNVVLMILVVSFGLDWLMKSASDEFNYTVVLTDNLATFKENIQINILLLTQTESL